MIRLKLWRIQNNYTQPEAAELLRLGLSTYCLLESGRLMPSEQQREKLVAYFGDEQVTSLFSEVSERVKAP